MVYFLILRWYGPQDAMLWVPKWFVSLTIFHFCTYGYVFEWVIRYYMLEQGPVSSILSRHLQNPDSPLLSLRTKRLLAWSAAYVCILLWAKGRGESESRLPLCCCCITCIRYPLITPTWFALSSDCYALMFGILFDECFWFRIGNFYRFSGLTLFNIHPICRIRFWKDLDKNKGTLYN